MADPVAAREPVELVIDGRRHEGWTRVAITRAIDTLAGSFELTLAERWAGQRDRFDLKAGAACTLRIGGETVMTGHVDQLQVRLSGQEHELTVIGRDRAGDLVDCSAIPTFTSYRGVRLETLVRDLVQPFGITVTVSTETGDPIRVFAVQQGETVQAAIERLCRMRGLIAISRSDGSIEITTPSASGASVMRVRTGDNLLEATATHDVSERFSEYIVKGQAAGDDTLNGAAAASSSARAADPAVTRYRPQIVIAEDQATIAALMARAKFEASVRAGRAQSAELVVLGWRTPGGALIAPNQLIDIEAPELFIEGRMLVEAARLVFDQLGERAELSVVPPQAYSQNAVPEQAEASRVRRRRGERA